jgi:PAS domain S-box-containing protein
MKLLFKSLLPLLLLLGAAFTAGLVAFYSVTRMRLEEEALLRQKLRAKDVAYQLKGGLAYPETVAHSVAAAVGPVRDEAELDRLVQALLRAAPTEAIHGIGVWFEPSAFPGDATPPVPYAHRVRPGESPVVGGAPRGDNPLQQPWYPDARKAPQRPLFLEPVHVEDSIYRLHARVLTDASHAVVGAVVIDVYLPQLHDILQQAHTDSGDELLYVTTPQGRLFVHPHQERLLAWAGQQGPKVARLEDVSLEEARRYEASQDSRPRRTAEVRIGGTGWTVHISTVEEALFASFHRFELTVLLLGVAFWSVLLAVPFLLHRSLRVRELSFALEERRRLHGVLERSERRLRDVLETSLDAVIAVTEEGRVTEWNAQAVHLLGWKAEEALGHHLSELLLHQNGGGEVGRELRHLLEHGEEPEVSHRFETTVRRQDGEVLPVELSCTRVMSGGLPVRYLFLSDITERRQAEEVKTRLLAQLQQRGAELRAIIENMVDSVVVSDVAGRITLVNKAGRQFFGEEGMESQPVSVGEIARLGFRSGSGRHVRPEDMPLRRALCGNVVVDADLSLPSPEDRRTLHLRVNAAPIRDERGVLTGAVAVARDVTEMVELDHLKDEFVKVAAHELKTPVAIMKSYAQLALKSEPTPATYRKMLDAINRGADRIDHIVRELLDVSQLYLGRLKLSEESLDLRELAEETVGHMAALSPQHRFSVRGDMPVIVHGDRVRLRQVLVVLLDNAVRYSPEGGRVEVRLVPGERDVEVCVSDEGIGIPAERQARLFQRFYRAHSGTPHDRGGMGVGLYISRQIIIHHGGTMRVSSEEGRGSTFCFSVPYTASQEEAAERP